MFTYLCQAIKTHHIKEFSESCYFATREQKNSSSQSRPVLVPFILAGMQVEVIQVGTSLAENIQCAVDTELVGMLLVFALLG